MIYLVRNDQLIRQWLLLRRLEASRGATLEELASSVPDDYPKHARTLRRDLEALEAAGFPLITERANGRTRWRLREGYRDVPALAFSLTELMALTFSRRLLKPLEGTEIQSALHSAFDKAAAALPSAGLDYVRALDGTFSVGLGAHKRYREHRETIDLLTKAVADHRAVQIRYFSASRNATSKREVLLNG